MQELQKPFIKDQNDLYYLTSRHVNITPFKFSEMNRSYDEKRQFYKIDGIDDYIIKDTTIYPFFFNHLRIMNILKHFRNKQDELPDISFPVGYYKDKGQLIGMIIPYYHDSLSLRQFIYFNKLEELKKYYHYDDNEIDNLITLCLHILELISKMYDKDVVYLDIHSGNFLFYQNDIKVIDFEPSYVYFTNKKYKYYYRLMKNYTMLVERICKRLGFKEILLYPGDTFMETEKKVKSLKYKLER